MMAAPSGPLGGEVWRTSDGITWTQVNTPGFGNLDAHQVASLQVFQNGLYAYVSHVGGTAAGADVWRCTKTICAEQGALDPSGHQRVWRASEPISVRRRGFRRLSLWCSRQPDDRDQLWRTANGSDWEKVDSVRWPRGYSNNRYVYTGAMTVFNGRLTLGITNWANGVGVWQKTLTADFTATPTRGAPPLTVQFTNTSAGDFTSSPGTSATAERARRSARRTCTAARARTR